jgi:hypothetical protein
VDLLGQSALLDKFLAQAKADAHSIGRVPLLAWKRHRKGWIAVVPMQAFRFTGAEIPTYHARYRDWMIVELETLLTLKSPCFWFSITTEETA